MFFFFGRRYHKHPIDEPEPVSVWSKFRSLGIDINLFLLIVYMNL